MKHLFSIILISICFLATAQKSVTLKPGGGSTGSGGAGGGPFTYHRTGVVQKTLGWYDVTDYGLVGDGITDNTDSLQALVELVTVAGGGTVYFPQGVFVIAGALKSTSNGNAQIVFPTVALSSPTVTVTFKGYQPPPNQFFTSSVLPVAGFTTIKSTLTGASGAAACISGDYINTNSGLGLQTNIVVNVYDLIFQAPGNPGFTMLNLQYFQGNSMNNVLVHTGSVKLNSITEPTNTNAYGIKYPEVSHTPGNLIGRVDVWGFYYGVRLSELTIAQNISAWGCKYAVGAAFGWHTNKIGVLGIYWCQNGIKALGGTTPYGGDNLHRLRVDVIQIEHANGGGASWQNHVYDVDDASNWLKGDAFYQTITGGLAEGFTFAKNGGAGFATRPIGSPVGIAYTPTGGADSKHPAGTITIDDNFLYYKTPSNIWKKVALTDAFAVSVSDNFQSANVTNINGRATVTGGKTWTAASGNTGTAGIASNVAKLTSASTTQAKAYIEMNQHNVDVRATLGSGTNANVYLLLAYTDESNYIQVSLVSGAAHQIVAGTATQLYAGSGTTTAGNYMRAVLTTTGITLYRGTTQLATATTDASLTGTKHGIYFYQNTATTVSNFEIY